MDLGGLIQHYGGMASKVIDSQGEELPGSEAIAAGDKDDRVPQRPEVMDLGGLIQHYGDMASRVVDSQAEASGVIDSQACLPIGEGTESGKHPGGDAGLAALEAAEAAES